MDFQFFFSAVILIWNHFLLYFFLRKWEFFLTILLALISSRIWTSKFKCLVGNKVKKICVACQYWNEFDFSYYCNRQFIFICMCRRVTYSWKILFSFSGETRAGLQVNRGGHLRLFEVPWIFYFIIVHYLVSRGWHASSALQKSFVVVVLIEH